MSNTVHAEFPEPLKVLFQPKRTKVLWGGRGAGRSWGIARALLIIGTQRPVRVLCAREFQNSISESVHKLLSDQIVALGLESVYEVQVGKIFGKAGTPAAGTVFSFEGIKNNTSRIKSYEGIDYCWVEEANKVSRASWMILIPTIRKPNSEVWLSFNPELETDYTYQRFVINADPQNSFVVKMTWRDNKWFPDVLRTELEDLKKRDFDAYQNVWEGHTLQMLEGTVYAKELRRAQSEDRIRRVNWDRSIGVSTFWDLGRADNTAIWFAQRVASEIRVLAYYEESGEEISHFIRELQSREYYYDLHFLPHDARAKRLGSKLTIEEMIRKVWPGKAQIVPKQSLTDGINAARMIFSQCYFDEQECSDGLKALRNYRYRVTEGQLSKEPLHDWSSDGADAFRYMALALRGPKPRNRLLAKLRRKPSELVESAPGLGWMR